jgi:hypothetical protein
MGSGLVLCDPLWVVLLFWLPFSPGWVLLFNKACPGFIKKKPWWVPISVGWLVGLFVVVMVLFNWPQSKINTYTMNLHKIRNYVACLWLSYLLYKGENLGWEKVWCYWEQIEEHMGTFWEQFENMVEH